MKAWQWYKKESLRLVHLPRPEPKPHEVVIRVESVGVCGSDIHYYKDGRIGENVLTEPVVLGHEYAGIVEEVGSHVDSGLIGLRVAVEPGIPCGICEWCRTGHYNVCGKLFFPGGPGTNGALCEFMAVDARFCFPVSETISPGVAAMVEPAAVAVHSVELAQLRPADTVAVFGLGVIGLLTVQMANICGAGTILAVDVLPFRATIAKRYGATASFCGQPGGAFDGGASTIEWIMKCTSGRGVDVAIDCTNSSDGPGLTCIAVRPAGTCVLTGISGKDWDPFPVSVARRKELTVRWCRRFVHNYPATLSLIESKRIEVESLITHRFSFDEAPQAFALTAAYADNVLKASIEW